MKDRDVLLLVLTLEAACGPEEGILLDDEVAAQALRVAAMEKAKVRVRRTYRRVCSSTRPKKSSSGESSEPDADRTEKESSQKDLKKHSIFGPR